MATITQTSSFVLNGTSSHRFSFNQFDPALGTLDGIRLGLSATSATTLSAENLELRGITLEAGATSAISMLLSTLFGTVQTTVQGNGMAALGAYDGTSDFAGTSGVGALLLAGSGSDVSELGFQSGFVGSGSLSLEAWDSTILHVEGGAGLRLLSDPANNVEATLTYNYTPAGDTTGSVSTIVISPPVEVVFVPSSFTSPTVTSAPQTVNFANQATGWTGTAAIARFDPAQGTLRAVNLRLGATLAGMAKIENQSPTIAGWTVVNQSLAASVTAPGLVGPLATANVGTSRPYTFLSNYDFSDDFAGTSGVTFAATPLTGTANRQLADTDTLAAFTGTGALDLAVLAAGGGTVDGLPHVLAELSATAGATLSVSYTYEPATPVTPIAVANGTTGGSSTPTPVAYAGPVAGILNEFAQITTDNLAISAAIDSWYVRTGDGDDAIQVFGGTNVLDGGRGSNFLTGGAGQDTFFVDAQWVTGPIWNTIENLAPGDAVTIWGIDSFGWTMAWRDGQGAAGHEGLTLHARVPAGPPVSVTLSGYTKADLDSGRLSTSYGTADDVPYFHIRAV